MEMIETFEPDLVILDIMMPKVTGYHLIELLRQRKDTEKLPIFILSAKDSIRDQKYGYKLGATTYLTKPFQPDRLTRNINTFFEHTPPDRRPKRWTLEETKNRLKVLLQHTGEAPPEKKRPPIRTGTVHHREAEAPDDQVWRG
jgi:DNA-binding response OmpR family regulator